MIMTPATTPTMSVQFNFAPSAVVSVEDGDDVSGAVGVIDGAAGATVGVIDNAATVPIGAGGTYDLLYLKTAAGFVQKRTVLQHDPRANGIAPRRQFTLGMKAAFICLVIPGSTEEVVTGIAIVSIICPWALLTVTSPLTLKW